MQRPDRIGQLRLGLPPQCQQDHHSRCKGCGRKGPIQGQIAGLPRLPRRQCRNCHCEQDQPQQRPRRTIVKLRRGLSERPRNIQLQQSVHADHREHCNQHQRHRIAQGFIPQPCGQQDIDASQGHQRHPEALNAVPGDPECNPGGGNNTRHCKAGWKGAGFCSALPVQLEEHHATFEDRSDRTRRQHDRCNEHQTGKCQQVQLGRSRCQIQQYGSEIGRPKPCRRNPCRALETVRRQCHCSDQCKVVE